MRGGAEEQLVRSASHRGAQPQQHLVMMRTRAGAQRLNRLHVQLEALRLERVIDRARCPSSATAGRGAARRRANSAARHTISGASLSSSGSCVRGSSTSESMVRRTAPLTSPRASGPESRWRIACPRAGRNESGSRRSGRAPALLDQLVILRQQKILAEQQGVSGEVVERDAADLRCQRANDFAKASSVLLEAASADSVN